MQIYTEGEAEAGLGSLIYTEASRNAAWPVLSPSAGVSFCPLAALFLNLLCRFLPQRSGGFKDSTHNLYTKNQRNKRARPATRPPPREWGPGIWPRAAGTHKLTVRPKCLHHTRRHTAFALQRPRAVWRVAGIYPHLLAKRTSQQQVTSSRTTAVQRARHSAAAGARGLLSWSPKPQGRARRGPGELRESSAASPGADQLAGDGGDHRPTEGVPNATGHTMRIFTCPEALGASQRSHRALGSLTPGPCGLAHKRSETPCTAGTLVVVLLDFSGLPLLGCVACRHRRGSIMRKMQRVYDTDVDGHSGVAREGRGENIGRA